MLHEGNVTVRKTELLAALHANKLQHVEEYRKAHALYLESLRAIFRKRLGDIEEGKDANHKIEMTRPRSHERDYDHVIRMMEMTTADEITLTEHQFRNYVEDEWAWTAEFISATAAYK